LLLPPVETVPPLMASDTKSEPFWMRMLSVRVTVAALSGRTGPFCVATPLSPRS
jgi:hypothetical protein